MRNLSIELKIILGIIFFTLFIVSAERYELSDNIIEQFIQSKKSKNNLLLDTISPIIALNISLGLESANKEYLDLIVKQNKDLEFLELKDLNNKVFYSYLKNPTLKPEKGKSSINFCSKRIVDSILNENLAFIELSFSDKELKEVRAKNIATTISIFFITIVLLFIFIFLIKREFKSLKNLSNDVLNYNPKLNNLKLKPCKRLDEVGIIHNAIKSMVEKINSYSKDLDAINQSLESKVQERTNELKVANKQLKKLSITDPLTQLYNRRYFEKHLQIIWNVAMRKGVDISLVMCDIDFFKNINDTYGHTIGDVVLTNIANIMQNSLKRNSDFIARYGGEEFVIVMYDTNIDGAVKLCKSIQNDIIEAGNFESNGTKIKTVTLSFGISSIVPHGQNIPQNLIKSADSALYKAKENGRNCIAIEKV